jgi:hypothetical protein
VIIIVQMIGAAALGASVGWRTARSRARAEIHEELARARAAMARQARHWQDAAARATAEAARVAREAEAYKDGCKHGREDVMSIMPLLVATQQSPGPGPSAGGDDGS